MSDDRYAQLDGAYVLGALGPVERREFEEHLASCDSCSRSVRELAALPGLLARVTLDEILTPAEPPPATLLPALAATVRRERNRRTRRFSLALAASVVALAGTTTWAASGGGSPQPPAGVALAQVHAGPLHANARLVGVAWGTRIDLTCRYDAGGWSTTGVRYALVVVDRTGHSEQVATWTAVPDRVMRVSGATGWSRSDIARVEIRSSTGTPVLRLRT
ncbi:MAG: anti-sigma factor family protein [Nocardioides sp.]